MGELLEYIDKQAEEQTKKKKVLVKPAEWLTKIAENANKCALATHIGRFTNPDIKVFLRTEKQKKMTVDYVVTLSVCCQDDIATPANYLATAKLLSFILESGQSVYETLLRDKESLRAELASLPVDYDKIVEGLLQIQTNPQPEATDERLRQVYFPVGEGNYHLLSVLPPSSLMIELTRRIRKMEKKRIESRNPKSETYGESYKQIYDLTQVSWGGTKPQNISTLNNEVGGRTYMLASVPPQIQIRKIVRPRTNFFMNSLRLKDFYGLFQSMHKVYLEKQNNMYVRHHARNIEDLIIDRVMQKVFALRQLEAGWSDAENNYLPQAQKIWLDAKYAEERLSDDSWQDEIAHEFTRWIMQTYERVMLREKIILGDGEFSALQARVRQAVQNTLIKTAG